MNVAIVGGGPAGLMAAEVLSDAGVQVDLYDAMPSVGRKFLLAGKGLAADAILFFHDTPLPERIQAVYRPEVNEWNGSRSLQFNLAHWSGL